MKYISIIDFTSIYLCCKICLSSVVSRNISKRWNDFQKQKEESILSHKDELLIVIYGAYSPPADDKNIGEKDRLIKLRDYLINEGYANTCLVEELPSDNNSISPNFDKSLESLEAADLNILVFTCRGNTDSVTRELTEAVQKKLLYKCKVFEEIHKEITAMGTLSKEELVAERYAVVQVECKNDDDLYEHVRGDVLSFYEKFIKKHL